MSESYTLDQVRGMSAANESYSLEEVRRMAPSSEGGLTSALGRALRLATPAGAVSALFSQEGRRDLGNSVAGGLRGAGSFGATGMRVLPNVLGGDTADENATRRAAMDAALREMGADPESLPYQLGKISTEVGATLPVGGILAKPVLALGGYAGSAAPVVQALGRSIASSGMTTGQNVARTAPLAARAGDMALRMAGGGLSGYGAAGLVDPTSAAMGGAIGTALPPALALAHRGSDLVAQGVRALRPAPGVSGQDVRAARDIATMAGVDVSNLDELARLRDVLRQQGPEIIPGQRSVAEILQTPEISQLQRSVAAVQPGPFVSRAAEREAGRQAVLERIAPIGNPREVAEEVGNNIAEYAIPQHQAAKAAVSAKFGAVDPLNESQVLLPIGRMQAAKDKFLGPGTFGAGGMAQQAINEAERIGTQQLPAIRQAPVGRQPQDILQAVRKLGGISPQSAGGMNKEIQELARKQTGTTGLVSTRGRTIDDVAELMHERGFLQSADPSALLDAMRGNLSGRPVYAADLADDAFRGRYERAMGDAPEALQHLKPVSFQELQNLRSSIGQQFRIANRGGNAQEAAALAQQRQAIDDALENLAGGRGQPGEFFAPDMVANYKDARSAHAAKELRFKTGPQQALFRRGGDGLPMAQGGEIPRRFFNGNASQVSDAQSFRRLVQDDPQLMGDLHRFAISDAASQTDRMGNLTNAKFNRWLDARAGATGEVFTGQQRAWLKAIAEDLKRSDLAESLGRSTGSDTAQKAASMMRLGLTDNPVARYLAGRVPMGNAALDFISGPARQAKAERLGGLLNNPEQVGGLLDVFIATQQPKAATGLLGADPSLYRAAPVLLSGGGR